MFLLGFLELNLTIKNNKQKNQELVYYDYFTLYLYVIKAKIKKTKPYITYG